jgi:phosphoribosylformylglycinamidine (FGAM) synthase PurS component
MKLLLIIYSCFLFTVILAKDDRIPIPNGSPKVEEKDIITDPETGDKIVSNQVIIIFQDNVTAKQQKSVLKELNGEVIGGIPGENVYYIEVDNESSSAAKIKNICEKLQQNSFILYASPRVISMNKNLKMNHVEEIERKGVINLDIDEKNDTQGKTEGENTIYDILLANRGQLVSCLRRQYNLSDNYHGSFLFRIFITRSGGIADVYILESNIKDDIVRNCLKNKIKKWNNLPKHSHRNNMQIEFRLKF